MILRNGDVVILYDDPKFFYLITEGYRYKTRPVDLHGTNVFFGKCDNEPVPDTELFEFACYTAAAGKIEWKSFTAQQDYMRLATEEEMRLIRILVL